MCYVAIWLHISILEENTALNFIATFQKQSGISVLPGIAVFYVIAPSSLVPGPYLLSPSLTL
jgi:hypothetical protein